MLQRMLERDGPGPRALVVTPTRELASQVRADLTQLSRHTKISSELVVGGVPIAKQARALRRRTDVLVACPGRLLDLLRRGDVRLDRVETLVLDEADHMLDMGFLPDVRRILDALPERRQTMLFSATMPREIRRLADRVLRSPAVAELEHSRPAATIRHSWRPIDEPRKLNTLLGMLRDDQVQTSIVFVRTKHRAKRLARRIDERGLAATSLQGNLTQSQRDRAVKGFREGRYRILVATDIAARGLDFSGVSLVVNYDVPNTPEAYTHRIGRTGRSGAAGAAHTFVSPDHASAWRAIERSFPSAIRREGSAQDGPAHGGSANDDRAATSRGRSRSDDRTASSRRGGGRRRRRAGSGTGAKPGAASSKSRGSKRRGRRGGAPTAAPAREGTRRSSPATAPRAATAEDRPSRTAAFGSGVPASA